MFHNRFGKGFGIIIACDTDDEKCIPLKLIDHMYIYVQLLSLSSLHNELNIYNCTSKPIFFFYSFLLFSHGFIAVLFGRTIRFGDVKFSAKKEKEIVIM